MEPLSTPSQCIELFRYHRAFLVTLIYHSPSFSSSAPPYNIAPLSTEFGLYVNIFNSPFRLVEPSPPATHFPDRSISHMMVSLDGLRSAIDRPNGSLRIVNGPSYSASLTSNNFLMPSRRHQTILGIITTMMPSHLKCITKTTMAYRVVPLS
jgi:hypothetical protein